MAVDWLQDVRIYDADADGNVVHKISSYCGIALQSRDGQLVAMADPKECETVRENFLKKKLGLSHSDASLDEAIQSVREMMKGDATKNRVTVYYLLSKHFGMLNMFGGAAAGEAGLAAAAAGAFTDDDDKDGGGSVAPLAAAAGLAIAGMAAVTGAASSAGAAVSGAVSGAADTASGAVDAVSGAVVGAASAPLAAMRSGSDDDDSSGGWGWLKWLLLAALLAALLFFLLKSCANPEAKPVIEPDAATVDAGATATTEPDPAAATATTTIAAPASAGVTAGERNGKPMLTVYFDTGKSDVTADLAAASVKVKAFVAANTGAKIGVSGFTDPTGNAVANAELSKKRAQAVGKALEAAGIPAASLQMVKPAESTDTKVDNNAARRVEVVVQ